MNIEQLYNRKKMAPLDWSLGRMIQRLGQCDDDWVGLAAAMVSRSATQGNVCLDLDLAWEEGAGGIDAEFNMPLPISLDEWLYKLKRCAAVGAPGDFSPLILDGKRLYLHRYWYYEQQLATLLLARCGRSAALGTPEELEKNLQRLFKETDGDQIDAARKAATRRFTVISGGPGTGKTYTVAKIILLLSALCEGNTIKIHLAAPTGKAAARLQEAIETALVSTGRYSADDRLPMPTAQTLHRLLGYMPSRSRFRYDEERPLPTDAVIVDEASMIDLALMHQLVQAVPQDARLILVGDKDQLASVEAGAVLGDICYGIKSSYTEGGRKKIDTDRDATDYAKKSPLRPHIQVLERSYRFDAHSGLGAVSRAINAGDARRVIDLLSAGHHGELSLVPMGDRHTLGSILERVVDGELSDYFACQDAEQAFDLINRSRVLCALRKGPYGAETLNQMIEQLLRRRGLIPSGVSADATWYRGRPLMVTRNDYNHGLFNGDTGIVQGPVNGGRDQMQVLFPVQQGGFREVAPHQLPEQQTVYAMTIHKSQGSEFDHVVVILPDRDTPLLTRELIYTAVTRARKSIAIHADPELLKLAVTRRIRRSSGLRDALWRKE